MTISHLDPVNTCILKHRLSQEVIWCTGFPKGTEHSSKVKGQHWWWTLSGLGWASCWELCQVKKQEHVSISRHLLQQTVTSLTGSSPSSWRCIDKYPSEKEREKTLEKVPCPLHFLLSTNVSALPWASNPCALKDAYPWIPEEFRKHHEVCSRQCQAHVRGSEGQNGHNLLLWELELLAQRLPLSWRCGAINANVFNTLWKGRISYFLEALYPLSRILLPCFSGFCFPSPWQNQESRKASCIFKTFPHL